MSTSNGDDKVISHELDSILETNSKLMRQLATAKAFTLEIDLDIHIDADALNECISAMQAAGERAREVGVHVEHAAKCLREAFHPTEENEGNHED